MICTQSALCWCRERAFVLLAEGRLGSCLNSHQLPESKSFNYHVKFKGIHRDCVSADINRRRMAHTVLFRPGYIIRKVLWTQSRCTALTGKCGRQNVLTMPPKYLSLHEMACHQVFVRIYKVLATNGVNTHAWWQKCKKAEVVILK